MSSSLDILETFFENDRRRVLEATADELAELFALVANYFDQWAPPKLVAGETRLHLNLRAFRGHIPGALPSAAVSYEAGDLGRFVDEGDADIVRMLRRTCSGPLLYADRVVDLDPLSFWVHDRDTAPAHPGSIWLIADAWEAMSRVAPLLDSGALILCPIPTDPEMALVQEQIQQLSSPGARLLTWYDGVALLTAHRSHATVPTMPWSAVEQLAALAAESVRPSARDQIVIEALQVIDLPLLTDLPVKVFADIRESEPAFAAWRTELRTMSRLLPDTPGDPERFEREARSLFDDVFIPRVDEVKNAISRSRALRDAAKEQPVRTSLGAVAAGGVAAATSGSIGVALASAGAAGLAQLLSAAALPRSVDGAGAVIVKLLNRDTSP